MDDRAVSAVVGFIFIVLIAITFVGLVQSVMLPEWNKAKEVEHSESVGYDFSKIGEAVVLSAISGKNSMISLKPGLSYPERPFLVSPKFASGTISAEELTVSVKSDQLSFVEKTHAIVLSPNYYYSTKPTFTFEHTAAFKYYENQSTVISEQSSFQKSTISLYIINTTFTTLAVTQPVNLVFEPVSYGGRIFAADVWVNFTSTNPDYWYRTLKNISSDWAVLRNGYEISVHAKNVYLSVSYLIAQASTAGNAEVSLSMPPYDIRKTMSSNQTLTVGDSKEFSAMVVDRFGNPVPNVYVEFDAGGGTLDRLNATTDISGKVSTFFTAVSTPTGYVTFSCSACTNTSSITYSLRITEPETSGAYRINWEKNEYVAAGSEGQTTEVEMRANTTPKAVYATVEFVTDNPYAVFNPRQTLTDTTGNATTILQITPQPDWDWLTVIKAYATTLASGDTAIVKFYLTKIWRVDVYEDFINGIFQDTQLVGNSGEDSYVILDQNVAGWLPGWSYRIPITITSSSDLASYQILVSVDTAPLISAGKMRSDCGDIRFTQSDGTSELNYWVESGCNGMTRIWVKTDLAAGDNVIYMYYGNDYATSKSSLSVTFDLVGEAGVVSVGGNEITVNLANTYSNPHVFASPVLSSGVYRSGTSSAQHHLITQVSANSFKIKQVESPSAGDGTVDTTQIAYLVLEDGVYYLGTSLLAEVREVTASGLYGTINLQTSFSSPAILADLQEAGSIGSNVYEDTYARVDSARTASFWLQIEQDDNSYPSNGLRASAAYLAIEEGVDSVFGIEARKTGDSITDSFTAIAFSSPYSSTPVVVAQLNSEDGWNSFYAVTRSVTTSGFELAGEEPASWDGWHTTEEFSWVSVPQGAIYGRKYTPTEPLVSFGVEESIQYVPAGNYSSYVKDLGANSTIKNFLWDGGISSATDMDFYIRASNTSFAADALSPTWIYIGKASDGVSFNLTSQDIVGRYVQWRASLSTSDPAKTPLLDEVIVGYQTIS